MVPVSFALWAWEHPERPPGMIGLCKDRELPSQWQRAVEPSEVIWLYDEIQG
jgi:hypothetical protein